MLSVSTYHVNQPLDFYSVVIWGIWLASFNQCNSNKGILIMP